MGSVAESAEHARERKAAAREAGRRRQAVTALAVADATITYTLRQLANGLSPEQARSAALEMAAELEAVAADLRRLTRMRPADRRVRARYLAGLGVTQAEIARQLGVSYTAVRYYVAGRPCPPDGRKATP
jgi:hypothetical protein